MQDLGLDHQREIIGLFFFVCVAIQDINVDRVFGNIIISMSVKFLGFDNDIMIVEYPFS